MIKHVDIQNPPVSEKLRLANEAFDRDLPGLLHQGFAGQWVAYLGDHCIEVAPERDTLLRKYEREYRDGVLLLTPVQEPSSFEALSF